MRWKQGVTFDVQPVIAKALPLIDRVHTDVIGRDAIVTSGTDGKHKVNSLHYKGLALDLRIFDLTKTQRTQLTEELRQELGDDWDVVLEPDHIHAEYDPK